MNAEPSKTDADGSFLNAEDRETNADASKTCVDGSNINADGSDKHTGALDKPAESVLTRLIAAFSRFREIIVDQLP